jgi:hypothetical protein
MISRRRDLEIDLAYLRDNIVQAIEQGNAGLVKDGLETYEELVVSFMEVVGRLSDSSVGTQALANDALSWDELRWISDAYVAMTDAAFHGTRRGIRNELMNFPIGVGYRAWAAKDVAVFGVAMSWTRLCYSRATDSEGAEATQTHADAAEYLGLRLHELLSYTIMPDLERRSIDDDEIALTAAFAEQVVLTFNALLKEAYDSARVGDFGTFARDLYDVVQPGHPRYDFAYWRLDEKPLGPGEEAIVELVRFLEVMSIGLDAWILRDVLAQKIDARVAREFRDSLMIPSEPPELWNLYLRTTRREYDRKLGWSWWETAERQPRRAYYGMDFSWLVLRAVLLRIMQVVAPMNHDAVNLISLDLPENVEYVLSDQGPVKAQLAELEGAEQLNGLVDFDVHQAAEKVRPLFETLRAQAEHERIERVERTPLSVSRIDQLRSDIVKGWHESSYLRAVFKEFGQYRHHSTDSDESSPLSIHRLDLKEMYIEPSRFSIDRAGTDYGRAMAVGEDRFVADTLVSQITRFSPDLLESSQVVDAVTQALETVDAPDAVILMVGVDPALWELRKTPDFEWGSPERRGSPSEPNGLFRGHAVYQVHEANKAFIVVADLKRTGVWHQYRPDVPERAQLLEDTLLFELEAFDLESAEALLAQAPNTYAYDEQRQARRTHEEQLDLVLRSVRLRILEKLRYEVREPDSGRVLDVKSEMERP